MASIVLLRPPPSPSSGDSGQPRSEVGVLRLTMDPLEAWRRWQSWLRAVASGQGTTPDRYGKAVLGFLAATDARELRQYTETECAEFLTTYASRGWAKHLYASALRSFFTWCDRHHLIERNPMEDIRLRKPRRKPPVTLTEDELVRLLIGAVYALGEREAWALLLVYLLGVRRSEAAGFRWSDIRDAEGGPVIEIRVTKGADSREPLPLAPVALECLARLQELPPAPQSMMGPEYILRVRPQTVTRWGNVAAKAAGLHLKKTGPHRLRASLATHLLKSGVDVRVVQKIMGHLRLESTAWYLAEAESAEVRAALSRAGHLRAAV